ncbi:MAG: hypothetical protein KJ015_12855 [Myxococcales bacterium]|nr:hypothetical protein [Sorangiineae bacterium PRO1]MCL4751051.1 hypothetical protein [Myxococcales bacterium]
MASPRIVSIGRGEDLVSVIGEACRGLDGWVHATGAVEQVELRLMGEGANPVRAPRGRFALVQLSGPTGGPYGVTLSRASDAGAEVWAGELVRARSDGVTAFVQPSALADKPAAPPQPVPQRAPAPPSSPVNGPVTPVPNEWAKAALASALVRRAAEAEHEPLIPEPGDLVQHFAFGLCEVLMGDDERLKIRDVGGPGRIREIRLDMLRVTGPGEKDGKRLYRLERKS